MERLTYELGHGKTGEYDYHKDNTMYANAWIMGVNKLGQLEDIEEQELGVSFITLFKALKGHIYLKRNHPIDGVKIVKTTIDNLHYLGEYLYMWIEEYATDLRVNTYGEYWALTEEELQ